MDNEFNIEPSSRHSIGDKVILDFWNCGKIMTGCRVSGVKYTDYGKVLFDITLYPFQNEPGNEEAYTILKDVDSYFVKTEYDDVLKNHKVS
jgi:hypothetical protein